MNKIIFTEKSLEEYMYWQTQDRKTLKKINILIKDINRNPFEGIGKPERLKGDLGNYWSRRIDESNRLVYCVNIEIGIIEIYQCRGHYDDK